MSASRRTFVSPLGVEADQKELIIAHLKEEIYLLKRNEQELFRLQEQYQALEHRLKALQDQKIQADSDFRDRHELAVRTIGQLKNQLDALRNGQRQRNLQLSDLNSDEGTLLGQLDQRAIELNKLENDLAALLADNQQLLNEKLRLEQTSTGVKKDNEQIAVNIRDLSNSLDGLHRKTEQLEKYLGKKKEEEALLKEKIMKYQDENNGIDADINTVNEQLGTLEADISSKQAELSDLQKNIAEASGQSDKQRGDALHYQKCTQAEVMRNNDLTKQLNQVEKTLRLRNGQVAEGNKTKENITAQNKKLAETNDKLRSDIEAARQHLQSLSLLNTELVQNLQKYSQEDDIVRNLIDRKLRVVRARNRIEQAAVSKNQSEGSPRKSRRF